MASQPYTLPYTGLTRRSFLTLAVGSLLFGCGKQSSWPRIGLALGGGGAKGLAHIVMLEAFDELGIRPYRIAGTSIGAIIGALYASGYAGYQIRALVEQFLISTNSDPQRSKVQLPFSLRWLDFIDPAMTPGGLLDSTDFIKFIDEHLQVQRFQDLDIPLQVMAADLWSGKAVTLKSGPLLPALQASMALPGIFAPVEINGRELVDGGVADPLPYAQLLDSCDAVVAIDVSGDYNDHDHSTLSFMGVLMHSFHTMTQNILLEKLNQRQPHIYIRPDIHDVRVLEFYKAEQVFAQAQPAKAQLIKALKRLQRNNPGGPGCSNKNPSA
ncbi:MAG: patatin-like phospholipase family protein [Gammaproteobacteria bacterium]|nr:patatin-like phospholipase family protein [Gammaproteobacteria bacterium]